MTPLPLSGYVLAGGKSSRMGTDKALLQLAGKSLAQRAVETLSQVCERVRIVGSPQLSTIAPALQDAFLACGPLGGMEAALRDAQHDWLLFLPVDLPFLPPTMLYAWAKTLLQQADPALRIAYFEADGHPQPLVCLLHRTLLPYIQGALQKQQYKVTQLFEEIVGELAVQSGQVLQKTIVSRDAEGIAWVPAPEEAAQRPLWFSNLNTQEEFAEAKIRMREASL